MNALVDALDATAALVRAAPVPTLQHDRHALLLSALRLGNEVMGVARRILDAQAALDAQASDRRPYPKPQPPKPPADPKPGK